MFAYFFEGDDLVTMAMNGWDPNEPAWWLNLQATPQATVTTVDGTFGVTGRAALETERPQLWDRWRALDKNLDDWASRRPTETAVVILTPTES